MTVYDKIKSFNPIITRIAELNIFLSLLIVFAISNLNLHSTCKLRHPRLESWSLLTASTVFAALIHFAKSKPYAELLVKSMVTFIVPVLFFISLLLVYWFIELHLSLSACEEFRLLARKHHQQIITMAAISSMCAAAGFALIWYNLVVKAYVVVWVPRPATLMTHEDSSSDSDEGEEQTGSFTFLLQKKQTKHTIWVFPNMEEIRHMSEKMKEKIINTFHLVHRKQITSSVSSPQIVSVAEVEEGLERLSRSDVRMPVEEITPRQSMLSNATHYSAHLPPITEVAEPQIPNSHTHKIPLNAVPSSGSNGSRNSTPPKLSRRGSLKSAKRKEFTRLMFADIISDEKVRLEEQKPRDNSSDTTHHFE